MTSFPILLAGTLAVGWWIGEQVQASVVHRIGSVTALYVDSFIAPHLRELPGVAGLSAQAQAAIDADLRETPLGKKIVALKIWRRDGTVLYDSESRTTGKSFPIDEGLATALAGNIYSALKTRSASDLARHGQPLPRLIETYTPLHADRSGAVIAAAEFYERPDEVDRDARAAQTRSWFVVAGCMLAIYLCLYLVVRRGSLTIDRQQHELGHKVTQLTELNRQNARLHERVVRAAERVAALNETFLARVSADIHDGPAQDLGFALMQLKNFVDAAPAATHDIAGVENARRAVESALNELRGLLAGIELPELRPLSAREVAERVIRDLQAKTGCDIALEADGAARLEVPLRVKVALYRLLQESLANAILHGACRDCCVVLGGTATELRVHVSDRGPGFDAAAAAAKGRLGLAGMRQRVELLGGTFELVTAPGTGTAIRVALPLVSKSEDSDE